MSNCTNCGHTNKPNARFCARCGAGMQAVVIAPTVLRGRYRIMRQLGKGGMAAVYQAQDLNLQGMFWAVKELSDAGIIDPTERQQAIVGFQREAQMLANLNHPNIVRVADFFQEYGKFYLVMEFVSGETLEDKLTNRGRALSEDEVLPWLQQLCDALNYLHTRQPPIIFRDLKPGNIMLDHAGAIKLIDFGIVRQFNPAKRKDTTLLGTPGYAPPEQYGKGQTDGRSDIYALGVTAHRLLSGYDPSSTPFNLPPVRSVNPHVSAPLADLVDRCTRNEMDRRPQRMNEVQQAITGILAARSVVLPPVTAPQIQSPPGTPPVVQPPKRPTTRLVQAVSQLTPRQMAIIGGGALAAIVIFVLLLGPWLAQNAPFVWHEVPAFLLAGPLVYAATRRMGPAFVAQAVVSTAVFFTQWVRFGTWQNHPDLTGFFLGVLLSALINEISFYVLYQHRPWPPGDNAWKWEMGWHSATMIVAMLCFFAPWSLARLSAFAMWPVTAALGAFGWFVGDTVHAAAIQVGVRWVKP